MSGSTILENNKLIAEFMGFIEGTDVLVWDVMPYVTELKDVSTGIPCSVPITEYLAFDTSYDWLMPVVEKIELSCSTDLHKYSCKRVIKQKYTFEILGYNNDFGNTTYGENKLDVIYENVIEFIKWYNKNKEK